MRLDDASDECQSESAPSRVGRKKIVECTLGSTRVHSGAIVDDRNHHGFTSVGRAALGANDGVTAVRHRIDGIAKQILETTGDQLWIDVDRAEIRVELEIERDRSFPLLGRGDRSFAKLV